MHGAPGGRVTLAHLFALAWILDLVVGDPARIPHPVRGMGRTAVFWERVLYRPNVTAGVFFWLACAVTVLAVTVLGFGLAAPVGSWAEALCSLYVMATLLATRSLHSEALGVELALRDGDLPRARTLLSRIVSRDTANLDEAAVRRAVLETVAENLSDGVVAPMFFLALAGIPGMILYKLASTLDSMVGYRTPRYEAFGRFSARVDDVLNLVPARMTAVFLAVLAPMVRGSIRRSWKATVDRKILVSPNAGWPETVLAGALNVRLAGPGDYHGRRVQRAFIHPRGRDPEAVHLNRAWALIYAVSATAALGTWGLLTLSGGQFWGLAGRVFVP
ncbi:MAG: cobalamin biosynthesis protein CobD [Deltaproteobacteria bacterium]|nr:cobalamin biosynthesis protein CobD [Deltaproteobacteria bacterium]